MSAAVQNPNTAFDYGTPPVSFAASPFRSEIEVHRYRMALAEHVQLAAEEKRQRPRRSLRCPITLLEQTEMDTRPRSIPAECHNIGDDGLYGVVALGFGVAIGQRYTFQLTLGERGPEPGSQQMISQQGIIIRTEPLIGPAGEGDMVGIGVRLVGQRSGIVPMPYHM